MFGPSYDEFVTYAIANRKEWEEKGEKIVEKFLLECQKKYGTVPSNEPRSPHPDGCIVEDDDVELEELLQETSEFARQKLEI